MRRYWHDWTDQPRPKPATGVFGQGRNMAEVMEQEAEQRAAWRAKYQAERSSLARQGETG